MSATRRKPTPEELTAIRARISKLSHAEKVQLAAKAKPIIESRGKRTQKTKAPENEDELHQFIIDQTGFNIPRVAVCEDHCAPFDPIVDGYFNRASALLIMKSREAGGTLNVSILQYVKSATIPDHEGVTFGAIEPQARRAYNYVKSFLYTKDEDGRKVVKDEIEGDPQKWETWWKNGASLTIIVGSKAGVNSPHPNTVHADELDLMDDDVWSESRNMSSSTLRPDGTRIPAQDVATSTRKSMHGLMQKLIDEIDVAEKSGHEPSWKLYAYCCFEIAEEVACCRRADPAEREARLTELGQDPTELCGCDRVVKGEWTENNPRTLESVCQGKFFKSRGWMAYEDIKRKFRNNPQVTWEAQMECRRPMADGLYLPSWTRQRYCIREWVPRIELGQIWQGIDWGGSAENAVIWVQGPLRTSVRFQASDMLLPEGAFVVFDELVEAEIGATKLADKVVAREVGWKRQIPGFRVTARFADMAGKQQRDDWREHNPPLRTVSYLPNRDFDPTVKTLQDIVGDHHYWVDAARCSHHIDDIESWRQKNGREVHDASSHTMAASRYLFANVVALERRKQHQEPGNNMAPVVVQRGQSHTGVAVSGSDSMADERKWRGNLGQHFDNSDNRPGWAR